MKNTRREFLTKSIAGIPLSMASFGLLLENFKKETEADKSYFEFIEKYPKLVKNGVLDSPYLTRKEMALAIQNQNKYNKTLSEDYFDFKLISVCVLVRVLQNTNKIKSIYSVKRNYYEYLHIDQSVNYSKDYKENVYYNFDIRAAFIVNFADKIISELEGMKNKDMQLNS